jgi:hypothetical protein
LTGEHFYCPKCDVELGITNEAIKNPREVEIISKVNN